MLFVFQFYPVCSLRKFISFGLGTVRSETVKFLACYLHFLGIFSLNGGVFLEKSHSTAWDGTYPLLFRTSHASGHEFCYKDFCIGMNDLSVTVLLFYKISLNVILKDRSH